MSDPLVSVIMGSTSDLPNMQHAADILEELGVPHEIRVVSAHRTPDLMFKFAEEAKDRGIKVIIAGAGGAAHLPGMTAAKTILPVIGVPGVGPHLDGMDSLMSMVQMPRGYPVGTVAIGGVGSGQCWNPCCSDNWSDRPYDSGEYRKTPSENHG